MSIVVQLLLALLPIALKWLVTLLSKEGKGLEAEGLVTGDKLVDSERLLRNALGCIPRTRPLRRAVVQHLLRVAPKALERGEPLSKEDKTELRGLLKAAE